ncbi:MAG: gliding motility-associated C-terminal domain-containing protein [Bacteroidales bacterium]|nr:gliding motility-associated C-terminal domain-containing protein [Bacteroidales bacterium]
MPQKQNYEYNVDFKYDTACLGNTTQLINISTSTDTVTGVYWDLNMNGLFDDATSDTVDYIFTESGYRLVAMRILYQSGASEIKIHQVPVGAYPQISFSYDGVCSPNTTTSFTDSTLVSFGNIATRFWNYGDGSTEEGINEFAYHKYNSGTFDVKLRVTTNFGCVDSLTKTMTIYPNPDLVLQKADNSEVYFNDTLKFSQGDSVYLHLQDAANYDSIIWPGNILSVDYYLKTAGHFTIKAYVNVCQGSTDFYGYTISNNTSSSQQIMPLITPNGDGYNDSWVVSDKVVETPIEVWIYNRAGSLVFHANPYNNDWQGTYNGVPLSGGTYYFVLKDASGKVLKGFITILR